GGHDFAYRRRLRIAPERDDASDDVPLRDDSHELALVHDGESAYFLFGQQSAHFPNGRVGIRGQRRSLRDSDQFHVALRPNAPNGERPYSTPRRGQALL